MDTKTRIKAARSRLGITQKVVADHCGVSITTVSKWEHGEALPQRGDNLDRLCDLLKVSTVSYTHLTLPTKRIV